MRKMIYYILIEEHIDQQGDFATVEKDYLNLNSSSFELIIIWAPYFNTGVSKNTQANSTSNNNTYTKLKKGGRILVKLFHFWKLLIS